MLENLHFSYDGITSEDMCVMSVHVSSGLLEEAFVPNREIREEKIRGRDKPYFLGYDLSPFEFPLTLYFENLEENKKREIARWLMVDYYKPLIFKGHPERIFYCMYTGDVKEMHNGLNQGYITLNMRCNSPFSYTPIYTTDIYDLSSNPIHGTKIDFENIGDMDCKPYIMLEKIGAGDISIINTSDSGKKLKMVDLLDGDVLNIDCENEEIETEIAGVYRYGNHNGVFLSLPRGLNRIEVHGTCRLQIKYRFTLYQQG